jgi:hypothetical protein
VAALTVFVIHNFAHFRAKSAFHDLNVSPELPLQHVPVGTDSESASAASRLRSRCSAAPTR